MKYEFILRVRESDESNTEELLISTDSESDAGELKTRILKAAWADEDGNEDVEIPLANSARRSTLVVTESTDKRFPVGTEFAGTAKASKAIGFHYDRVASALSTAKAFERGDTVTVRGVTLKRKPV